jgi:fructokinase
MILCCGEALIDMMPGETREGAPAFRPLLGGSVFNTSVALGRLGIPVKFFGGLSSDFFGDELREAMRQSNVDFSLSPVSDRYTILAFVKLEGGQARYAFIDEGSACRMIAVSDIPGLANEISAIHLGSFPLIAEPSGSTIETLCQREHAGRVIHFDPNIRPSLVKDRSRYLERIGRVSAIADIIKLSEDDLDWITDGADAEGYAARALGGGARIVVLTRGARGALAFTRRHRCEARGRPVKVADTIGAGDTFTAGFLAALSQMGVLSKPALAALEEACLQRALDFATSAASVTVSRPGADPPWAHELQGAWP